MSAEPESAFVSSGGWPAILRRLMAGDDLTKEQAGAAMGEVLAGAATPAQVAAFVVALRTKGETVDEMAAMVRTMLDHAEPLPLPGLAERIIDTCGTGGDRSRSINVSTIAALIAAGAGVPVCKHGGRAATSAAGSADVLEALGVVIDLGPEGVARCVAEAGMGFCFAPRFHPAMRHAVPVRRELGVATVFNFLGPLANPARARHQVVGVSDRTMAETMLGVLMANGCRRAMVVHGEDGIDELTTTAPTVVLEAIEGEPVRRYTVEAGDLGLRAATLDDLRGADASHNAECVRKVLAGERGAHRDVAVLNAAAALVVGGISEDLAAGVARAGAVIDGGEAARVLDDLVRISSEAAGA